MSYRVREDNSDSDNNQYPYPIPEEHLPWYASAALSPKLILYHIFSQEYLFFRFNTIAFYFSTCWREQEPNFNNLD